MTDIQDKISKLATRNGELGVKIATNKAAIRTLVGKLVGVKAGDIVVSKGERYQVEAILSDSLPKKGKPILSGLKLAKNGNAAKRPVEIVSWSKEEPAAKAPTAKKPGRKPKAAAAAAPAKRRGRPPKADRKSVV